jgi:hypothetical protein
MRTSIGNAVTTLRWTVRVAELHFCLLDWFEISKLVIVVFPLALRAIAEGSKKSGIRLWEYLHVEGLQDRLHAGRIIWEMTPERTGVGELATSGRRFFGLLQLALARTYPSIREMCQAVFNACPGILEGPKAVANTAVEVALFVSRASKCGIADFGIGLGLGYGIRVVITILALFQALFFLALGRGLRGISVNDKFTYTTSLYLIMMSLPSSVRLGPSPNSRNTS